MRGSKIESSLKICYYRSNTRTPIKSPEEIIQIFRTKEVNKDWSFAQCKPSETGKLTHNYHRYPAKFIPQIAEKLINEYIDGKEAHIDDPFLVRALQWLPQLQMDLRQAVQILTKSLILLQKLNQHL